MTQDQQLTALDKKLGDQQKALQRQLDLVEKELETGGWDPRTLQREEGSLRRVIEVLLFR